MKKAKNRHDRPVTSKYPMHLVLKSSKAKGEFSFRSAKNLKRVRHIVDQHCRRYGVKLHEFSNNFNHLHILAKFPSRPIYVRFIRSLSGALALAVTGASKSKNLKQILGGKFWDFRPFTRIVIGNRAYRIARDYVILNQLEQLGMIPHRTSRLKGVQPREAVFFLKNTA